MDETIKIKCNVIDGAINQAKFLAQQYFNNNGMGHRVVTAATFVDGGIHAVFDEISVADENPKMLKAAVEPQKVKSSKPQTPKKYKGKRVNK